MSYTVANVWMAAPVDYEQLPVYYEPSYEQHEPLLIIIY